MPLGHPTDGNQSISQYNLGYGTHPTKQPSNLCRKALQQIVRPLSNTYFHLRWNPGHRERSFASGFNRPRF